MPFEKAMNLVPCVAILPPANQVLAQPLPPPLECTQTAFKTPETLGEHLKRRRLEVHLIQSQLAKRLGVHRVSVQNWERNIYQPATELMPKIIEFSGYDPQQWQQPAIPR
ncbi:MAG TPA: helix-turn-helix transcriptional regulator [Candidatus Limnocylindrales bacterium]|nr:helix-turn-helix transcriptional regulator [Candidatus Limnocylindrales bacterium]